jgi:hypothetical protein
LRLGKEKAKAVELEETIEKKKKKKKKKFHRNKGRIDSKKVSQYGFDTKIRI